MKEQIITVATMPLLRDNSFYVKLAIVQMQNPHVVADIIRKYPTVNPGADFYEQNLLEADNLISPGHIQVWLDKFGDNNFYAAMAVALQLENPTDVGIIIEANKTLFEGAAHIVASQHDVFADRKMLKDPTLSKIDILQKYRSNFVDEFAKMIHLKTVEANWLEPTSL